MLCPVYELGELPRRLANLGLGMCSGISQQVSASLVVFFLVLFFVFLFPFYCHYYYYIVLVMIVYYYILVCYPSLNCFYLNLQVLFLIFPPIPLGEEIGQGVLSECLYGVYYQLGLNLDITEESKAVQIDQISAAADLVSKFSQTRYKIKLLTMRAVKYWNRSLFQRGGRCPIPENISRTWTRL